MGLFGKNDKKELPPLMTEADFYDVANYDSALNYLIGLSDEEYGKVTQVAAIHRKAYQDAAAVLGTPNEPTTFINPPEPPAPEPNFLDDDELLKTPNGHIGVVTEKKPKATKVNVKSEN